MLFKDNPYSFLTGNDPFVPMELQTISDSNYVSKICFELKHEGFVGIPHGGIGMGLCLDAWRKIGKPDYPVTVNFKFGGSGIRIGDEALFQIERLTTSQSGLDMKITKNGDKKPYLRAEITGNQPLESVPTTLLTDYDNFRALPYYRNCFVCGHARTDPGLQRRFRLHQTDSIVQVTVPWGFNSDDFDRAALFLISKEELHPAALISIFDENTAWAGFMLTKAAGLSVRLEFTLLRPVVRNEKLIFIGEPTGIRGNPAAPRFFTAQGTIFSLNGSNPDPVAFGRGEWIIMQQYTDQIKKNLLPENDWKWVFL
ncbi:MAG: hypothetical protein NTY51_03025 [Deltaproteobacteria bacterium]|nr:hypothetical protein [Deltaproteobacteria bacterium]